MYDTVPDVSENPNCLQTTLASTAVKESSHTVPHVLLLHSSTRPSRLLGPPTSLTVPPTQPVHTRNGRDSVSARCSP